MSGYYLDRTRVCRLCKQSGDRGYRGDLVKYAVRSYAHPACALKKHGAEFFQFLTPWQATQFPYLAAVKAGCAEALKARCAEYRE